MASTNGAHPRLHCVVHPLLKVHLTRLRDQGTPPSAFRDALEVASGLLVAAALQDLELIDQPIHTPLQATVGQALARPLAFVPILRAGLGMLAAAQRLAPDAAVWHLGLYRDEATLQPVTYYSKLPKSELTASTVVVLDPMLATAGSALAALELLQIAGAKHLKVIALVASPEGLSQLAAAFPDVAVTVAAVDERLTGPGDPWPSGYIIPGLGDAGDRQFGTG